MLLRAERIGGAFVRRGFTRGGEYLKTGTPLSRAEVLAFPPQNRQSLVDGGYLEVYPPGSPVLEAMPAQPDRFVVSRGFGNFDVYEGRKLNTAPMTKDEAQALAGTASAVPAEPQEQGRAPDDPNPPVEEPPGPGE